ncbi:MAG: protocatechuate 3,4-dioxygenase, partial [Acidobacteria bacterium]|nr:protocatechuate 3,4-dioxygenase [Acidobacteriota bacterium]
SSFQSGSSEIKNYIATAGVLDGTGLKMELLDYIPCYRSEAGTGNAMVFMTWS